MSSAEIFDETSAVNLDDLLKEYYKWKLLFQESILEKKKLEENGIQFSHQYQLAQDNEKALLLEISQLKEIICNLQTSLSKLCQIEDKNILLCRQVTSLENSLEILKKEHESQKQAMKKCHEDTEKCLQLKIKELENNHSLAMTQEINNHRDKVMRKDEQIEILYEKLKCQEKESKDSLLKMRLEYEEKLVKLQDQQAKAVRSTGSVPSASYNDIYRRKLQHLQQDYESKIDKLNLTVTELQEKLGKASPSTSSVRRSLTLKRKKDFL